MMKSLFKLMELLSATHANHPVYHVQKVPPNVHCAFMDIIL